MKKICSILFLSFFFLVVSAQTWPVPSTESKAGTRWWWMGSAVDKENLQWSISEYAKHGIGALEITPIYGVQGLQDRNIEYLSDKWFEMLRYTMEQCERNGIELDMATGTGWPFGGPWVPLKESACKAVFVEREFTGDEVKNLDLSVPEKERKNAFLEKVMLYADGQTIDVTAFVNAKDGTLSLNASQASTLRSQASTLDSRASTLDSRASTLRSATSGDASLAQNAQLKKVIALYIKYGVMKVKRPSAGGEGLVVDHFDKTAVAHYLKHISDAFDRTHTPYPHTFFNDSYEVEAATWTPLLLKEFEQRRGYRLEDHFPELLSSVQKSATSDNAKAAQHSTLTPQQILSDYRETLGDLLLENFTEQWTAWAHAHGAITRNQAHGSPANLIDCYAAVDIPEIEGFGLSDLGINGLRKDPGNTRKNDSDYSMFKYAPSAAHVCGKPYTSSETFTWLTEHFRTSLSQLKPDLDLMFCAGVNHMFFHGTNYSPKDDEWPGWKFYASIDMSPTNSIWRDAPYFMEYVERCQSFLQWGQPDNDFLVYLPVRDMWKKNTGKLLMQFSIHAMGKLAPEFIQSILALDRAGFDCDYISDRLLMTTTCKDGLLVTAGGTVYKGLIIPGSGELPAALRQHLDQLKAQGARILYGIDEQQMGQVARPEEMKTQLGLKAIRRKNASGYHYFMANLSPNDVHQQVRLAVPFKRAVWFNPLTGEIREASFSNQSVDICLRSGESMILQTYSEAQALTGQRAVKQESYNDIVLDGPWTLSFTEEAPKVDKTYQLPKLQTWETLDEQTQVTMGTGVYTTKFRMSKKEDPKGPWMIDLGDVRESARVYVNGTFIGCAWSVPFVLETKGTLKAGENEVRIEVTNLPANRIADLDRRGVKWRKMEDINVVNINYKKTLYNEWEPVPSGLASTVKLFRK